MGRRFFGGRLMVSVLSGNANLTSICPYKLYLFPNISKCASFPLSLPPFLLPSFPTYLWWQGHFTEEVRDVPLDGKRG